MSTDIYYTTGQVMEMTGVPAKTLERWTKGKEYENDEGSLTKNLRNQDLLQIKLKMEGNRKIRYFTREDIEKILLINLYRDFDLSYDKIREILQKKSDFISKLIDHNLKLNEQIEKLYTIKTKINLIINKTDEAERFELIKILSKILADNEIRKIIESKIDELKEGIKTIKNQNAKLISDNDFEIAKNNLIFLLDQIIEKGLFAKTLIYHSSRNISNKHQDEIEAMWSKRVAIYWDHIGRDNSLLIDLLLSKDGEILHSIWKECTNIEKGDGEYLKTYNFMYKIKKILQIPYLSLEDTSGGYPLIHKLYTFGDISNLKRLINLEKVDINSVDKHNLTVLDYACRKKKYDIIVFLLKKGAQYKSDTLLKISESGNNDFAESFIEYIKDPVLKFFLHSVMKGDTESVDFILKHKFEYINENFLKKYINTTEKVAWVFNYFPSVYFLAYLASSTAKRNGIINLISNSFDQEYREFVLYSLINSKECDYFIEYLDRFFPSESSDLTYVLERLIVDNPSIKCIKYVLDNYSFDFNKTTFGSSWRDHQVNTFFWSIFTFTKFDNKPEIANDLVDLFLPKLGKKQGELIYIAEAIWAAGQKIKLAHINVFRKLADYFTEGEFKVLILSILDSFEYGTEGEFKVLILSILDSFEYGKEIDTQTTTNSLSSDEKKLISLLVSALIESKKADCLNDRE